METKKIVILSISALSLLGVVSYFIYKKVNSKKTSSTETGDGKVYDTEESFVSKIMSKIKSNAQESENEDSNEETTNDESGVVPKVNKEVTDTIASIATGENATIASTPKTISLQTQTSAISYAKPKVVTNTTYGTKSYSSQGKLVQDDTLNQQGYAKGLDLYHKMISTCATLREQNSSVLRNYALKGGLQGKTFSGICYTALKDMYGNNAYYEDAMKLIGSQNQFRRDLMQYIEQGTYRI